MDDLSPAVLSAPTRSWFARAFPAPTPVQRDGFPLLARGEHALLIAPTGSGKTLAAFLAAIDRLMALPNDAEPGTRVVYVSPLKALVYDIERNLRAPLVGISHAALRLGVAARMPTVAVRTGDTTSAERRRQAREPADILVTTPESLFLILSSEAANNLRTTTTVIVDEVHAIAGTKRGVHLALSLERLAERAAADPQRIGLSATVAPAEEAARFLGGDRPVVIVDQSAPPRLALSVCVPVPDMERPPVPAPRSLLDDDGRAGGPRELGLWPSIYPRLLDLIEQHRSTIVFTNSRGLCEKLALRLNELYFERHGQDSAATGDVVRAHHGSVSHEQRAIIEEGLKAGRLRAIVATSSLELGIDMGAVDLVVLVESPGAVARGLQRVGRAGHQVGEISRGVIFPKFRGDLLECAVITQGMARAAIEPTTVPRNPLDVLAQQVVAMVCERTRTTSEVLRVVRRAYPYRDLDDRTFAAVLDMLSGRYPAEDFADLRPRLVWDRARNELRAREGAALVMRTNAGTIPDRGLYGVYLAEGGRRIGELDEEMVHESRKGDTFLLGASTWRVTEITRDRVLVQPAPGEPGRMPFWRGDGPGRPIALGRALGAFVRELAERSEPDAAAWLRAETPLDDYAVHNLLAYLGEQKVHTGTLPTDRAITVERFRDELGDWRVCVLSPFGARVHAPWALALEQLLAQSSGFDVSALYTDDGIALRLADGDQPPGAELLFPDPDEIEELLLQQLGNSALFASLFRENAARALLLPRRRPGQRTALWQQRLRAKNLLAVVRRYPSFPIVLETYRQCLRDVFDLDALRALLQAVRRREVRVDEVETQTASPFARSLVFAWVANYLYEADGPLAERKAQALTLDRNLLRELLGTTELRELLDPAAIAEVEAELQGLDPERRAATPDELHDLLRRIGDLSLDEAEARSGFLRAEGEEPAPRAEVWLAELVRAKRAVAVRVAGVERFIAAEDAARYRDGLGVQLPAGLPDALLEPAADPLGSLVRRYARCHGPFAAEALAERFGLLAAQVEPVLAGLEHAGELLAGSLSPAGGAGGGREWCAAEVLRRIKRRTLAHLRQEAAPVEAPLLGRFLPSWHGAGSGVDRRTGPARALEVVEQLEGLALPWSALVQSILPARVPNFDLGLLDLLAASGELVWVGRGALGLRDGRVALYRREHAPALLAGAAAAPPPATPVHQAVLETLTRRGACFTVELEQAAAATSARALDQALWDLVWAGVVTNDTFMPLRALGGRSAIERPRLVAAPRAGSPFSRRRASGAAGKRAGLLAGRWSLVETLTRPVPPTERAYAAASSLLERYGIVSREAVAAEELPGGFGALLPVLRELEEAGVVRRGYFVAGLTGRQYALPGAIDRLRSERRAADEAPLVLAAVDPANPWGALLPWPDRPAGARPRRVAGAFVVLVGGEPVFYLDAGQRSLLTFPRCDELLEERPEEAGQALAALVGALHRLRRRSVLLERIDGLPAKEWRAAAFLLAHGFERDYRGLVCAPASAARASGGHPAGNQRAGER